jgi:RecB family exonuclease
VRTLAECVAGRTLLGVLDLPDRGFRRDDVVRVLAGAPLRFHGQPVPGSAWERLTRDAGVVGGLDQWDARLRALAARRAARSTARGADDPRGPDPNDARIDALRAFVAHLGAILDPPSAPRTWSGWAALAHRILDELLPGDLARRHWPPAEQDGCEAVERAIDRLAGLDALGDGADLDVFRRTLRLELDEGLERVGRAGDGVLVGTVGLGLGVPLERVFVVGLAEGLFPARTREDSLLSDDERRAAGGDLPLRAVRPDDDERALLAVLAATTGARVLSYPRGDLRKSTERMPSRFLLDTVEALHGRRVYGDGLAGIDAPWCRHVASFASGVAHAAFPATEQEHRLRALGRHVSLGGAIDDAPGADDRALSLAVRLVTARRSAAFTRFDGNLTHVRVPGPARDGVVVSPTRLETYAVSPHAYLMQSVLGVHIPEEPEDRLEISALDRGSLVHEALEAFLVEVLARPEPPAPGARWSVADRDRLLALAAQRCDAYEAAGRTGRALFWRRERARVLADLEVLLELDGERLAGGGLAPIAAELRFGDDEPLPVALGDGRVLRFRGSADRVDRSADGSLVVIDYKSGRPYREPPDDDVTAGGTHLQLPVYAHAARAAFGDDNTPVTAAYWFATSRGGFTWLPVLLTPAVGTQVDRVLRAIVDAIEAGVFPCPLDPPGSWSWRTRTYDDPDARGTRDRWREWERKCQAPELAAWFAIGGVDDA